MYHVNKSTPSPQGDSFKSGGPLETDTRTWNKVEDSTLQTIGLDPALFKDNQNNILGWGAVGYKAALYKSDRGEYILAFAGTNPKSIKDLWTDAKGGLGFTPKQFRRAMETAQEVQKKLGENVVLAGHSLGDGLATYASIGTGSAATVFNPMDIAEPQRGGSIERCGHGI